MLGRGLARCLNRAVTPAREATLHGPLESPKAGEYSHGLGFVGLLRAGTWKSPVNSCCRPWTALWKRARITEAMQQGPLLGASGLLPTSPASSCPHTGADPRSFAPIAGAAGACWHRSAGRTASTAAEDCRAICNGLRQGASPTLRTRPYMP